MTDVMNPANRARKLLDEAHRDLCNDFTTKRPIAEAIIEFARRLGLVSESEATARKRALEQCPGHDGRSWCAYCGGVEGKEMKAPSKGDIITFILPDDDADNGATIETADVVEVHSSDAFTVRAFTLLAPGEARAAPRWLLGLRDEGYQWIRGQHTPESEAAQALLATYILREQKL